MGRRMNPLPLPDADLGANLAGAPVGMSHEMLHQTGVGFASEHPGGEVVEDRVEASHQRRRTAMVQGQAGSWRDADGGSFREQMRPFGPLVPLVQPSEPTLRRFMRSISRLVPSLRRIVLSFSSLVPSLRRFMPSFSRIVHLLRRIMLSLRPFVLSLRRFMSSFSRLVRPLRRIVRSLSRIVHSLRCIVLSFSRIVPSFSRIVRSLRPSMSVVQGFVRSLVGI
jgi:hypothetical protein